jgi:hypothetical protein
MAITKTQIEKWNTYFNSLTKPQKRVAIAEDVIKQIKAKKYLPTNLTYIEVLNGAENDKYQVQQHFNKVKCECCALGSLFLSEVKFNNSCTFEDLRDDYFDEAPIERLKQYFSLGQLVLIEYAFEDFGEEALTEFKKDYIVENGVGYTKTLSKLKISLDDIKKAKMFCEYLEHPKDRLTKILTNIIKNKGTFKP